MIKLVNLIDHQGNSMNAQQKRIPIDQLRRDDQIEQVFLVASRELRRAKSGKSFIQATLQDSSGQIGAKMWDASPAIAADMPPDSFIKARVRTDEYQGNLQVIIESFRPVDQDQVDLANFLRHTDKDVDQLFKSTLDHLRKVKDKSLLQLTKQFVTDKDLMEKFKSSPAAMAMHHAYVGGLLEHTENMLSLALQILPNYPQLNPDLLLVGIFLHDIGKTVELSTTTTIKYTDTGQFLSHLIQGTLMIQEKAALAAKALGSDFPKQTLDQLMHIILSHHGQYEYGSPVLPATAEALVVHYLDNLDAKLNALQQAADSALPNDGNWTPWLKVFERRMFLGNDSPPQ